MKKAYDLDGFIGFLKDLKKECKSNAVCGSCIGWAACNYFTNRPDGTKIFGLEKEIEKFGNKLKEKK